MNLFIAIASGHRRSHAALLTSNQILSVVSGDSLNQYCYSADRAVARLEDLIRKLLGVTLLDWQHSSELKKIRRIVVSMPGGHLQKFQSQLFNQLQDRGWPDEIRANLVFEEDTFAGLVAGTEGCVEGVCAYASTGAMVLVVDTPEATRHRYDGWGPLLGDRGGAHGLGLYALQSMARQIEQGRHPAWFTLLEPACSQSDGGTVDFTPASLVEWFHRLQIQDPYEWRVQMTEIARIVLRESRNPNQLWAGQMVDKAAHEFALTTRLALEGPAPELNDRRDPSTLRGVDHLIVVCQGFMFHESRPYYESFVRRLAEYDVSNQVLLATYRPLTGTALLALGDGSRPPYSDVCKVLFQTIQDLPSHQSKQFKYF